MTAKLRTRRTLTERGICEKCLSITASSFAAAVEDRRREHQVARKKVEDELDDLDLDDLDEVSEDEDEDEEIEDEVEDEDDEDEDPDEAPKAKRGRKSKSKKAAKPKKTGIGTAELAEAAGVSSRELRQFLRGSGYQPRDEREGRYSWPSVRDPEAREIIKAVKSGAVKKMNKEKVDALKAKKGKAKAKSASKKTSSRKKASAK